VAAAVETRNSSYVRAGGNQACPGTRHHPIVDAKNTHPRNARFPIFRLIVRLDYAFWTAVHLENPSCYSTLEVLQLLMPTPELVIRPFTASPAQKQIGRSPITTYNAEAGWKIIGGGARVNWKTTGSMLLSSYPEFQGRWIATSADNVFHQHDGGPDSDGMPYDDRADIDVYVLAIYDPGDVWEVQIKQSDPGSPAGEINQELATLDQPNDRLSRFTLTGGGARSYGYQNYLTASFPYQDSSWSAKSKSHRFPNASRLEAFAIGLRYKKAKFDLESLGDHEVVSPVDEHPRTLSSVPSGYILTGGGAFALWSGAGNLLTSSAPINDGLTWEAQSKSHVTNSPCRIISFACGIKWKNGITILDINGKDVTHNHSKYRREHSLRPFQRD
jgi:hypothetical protein